MSALLGLKKYQRVRRKRDSLEDKTKILEENAVKAKLAIDRQLLVQVLEEENRAHDDAVKELADKIANLESEIKSSSEVEGIPIETASEPAEETTEPSQESSTEVDEPAREDPFHDVRTLLEQSEVTAKAPKKKKKRRGFFSSSI